MLLSYSPYFFSRFYPVRVCDGHLSSSIFFCAPEMTVFCSVDVSTFIFTERISNHMKPLLLPVAHCTLPKGRKSLNWSANSKHRLLSTFMLFALQQQQKTMEKWILSPHKFGVNFFFCVASSTKRSDTQLHEMHVHEHDTLHARCSCSLRMDVADSTKLSSIASRNHWAGSFFLISIHTKKKVTTTEHVPARSASQARFFPILIFFLLRTDHFMMFTGCAADVSIVHYALLSFSIWLEMNYARHDRIYCYGLLVWQRCRTHQNGWITLLWLFQLLCCLPFACVLIKANHQK